MHSFFSMRTLKQFVGYAGVGVLNTTLSFIIINSTIFLTGVTKGNWFLFFSFLTFCVVVLHSFVWNRLLIFKRDNPRELHREYAAFFGVSAVGTLLNLAIIHVLVNVIGAPATISDHLWANIAIGVTIPFAVICNFLGYKFFVFKV